MKPIVVKSAAADEIARIWSDLRRVDRLRKGSEVLLDVSALTEGSAAFEAFFVALDRHAAARAVTVKAVDPHNMLDSIRTRYDFAAYAGGTSVLEASSSRLSLVSAIGRYVCEGWRIFGENAAFLGETAVWTVGMLRHPGRFRFRDAALTFERAGFDGLPITTLIGFLLGLILAFESAASLRTFGVEVYVADLIAIGLFRELGPLVTAIILAGRSGSAFAAEIGTMKVDEELDALVTFGLPPVQFLVLPRVLAAMFAMPVLTIFAELAGLMGGAIVLRLMDVPTVVFWSHVKDTSTLFMIGFGLAKSALFGLLVGLVGCGAGLRTRNTADGVGVAATNAVVGGIVAIAVTDGLLAVICYVFGV